MFSKGSQKNNKHKLIIPQLKTRQNSKGRKPKMEEAEYNQYQTDNKRNLNQSDQSIQQIRQIMSNCVNCKTKISQFVTKKPNHLQDKSIQTTNKPFLIDLIQEKVQNIVRQNSKLNRLLSQRQDQLQQRQSQLNEVEDKFTSILLTLTQEIAMGRRLGTDWHQLKKTLHYDSDTPSYLKALQLQNQL